MSCTANQTQFKGFSIEIAEANIFIGIVDTFDNRISNAQVKLDCGFKVINETSDENGIVRTSIPKGTGFNLKVTKDNYHLYDHQFAVVKKADFTATSNFPIKIVNASNVAVTGATAKVIYNDGTTTTEAPATENNGIYEGVFKYGFKNTLNITTTSSGSYNKSIESFVKIALPDTEYTVIPIVKLA